MIIKVKGITYYLKIKHYYSIVRHNRNEIVYYLLGVINLKHGVPSLKLRHPDGFTCYIRLDDIRTLKRLDPLVARSKLQNT